MVFKTAFRDLLYYHPSMKPQMLFGAVMAVVGTFQSGAIGVQLSGSNPTPQYAGQLLVNHIEDFGFIRYEMGYASAVSVVHDHGLWFVQIVVAGVWRERSRKVVVSHVLSRNKD